MKAVTLFLLLLAFGLIGVSAAASETPSGVDSTKKPRSTRWITQEQKKGNPGLVLFATQDAIKEYYRQLSAGNRDPDTLHIEILLRRSRSTIGRIDEKVDPKLKAEFRLAISEAENILKNSKTPRRLN